MHSRSISLRRRMSTPWVQNRALDRHSQWLGLGAQWLTDGAAAYTLVRSVPAVYVPVPQLLLAFWLGRSVKLSWVRRLLSQARASQVVEAKCPWQKAVQRHPGGRSSPLRLEPFHCQISP